MTDRQDDPDGQPPSGEQPPREDWTWQRPEDGSPVFGADSGATASQPPPPPALQPAPAPPSYPPVVGPAVPPSQAPVYQHPPPPPAYGQQPPPTQQYGYPPTPPPEGWQPQQQQQAPPPYGYPPQGYGYPPPQQQYPPPVYGQYPPGNYQQGQWPPSPAYAPPPGYPSPYRNDGATRAALILGFVSLVLACCCWPIGVATGIVGATIAYRANAAAKAMGVRDDTARLAFWLNVIAATLAFLNGALGIIIQLLFPDLMKQAMKDVGLG